MKPVRLIALPLLAALAACADDPGPEGERKTAAGEVLGGTISDDMLPLDTVTSQSPPLREKGDGSPATKSGDDAADATDAPQPVASEAAPEPVAEPAATATPETEG